MLHRNKTDKSQSMKTCLRNSLKPSRKREDREMYEECGKIHQAIETLTKSESKK